MVVVKKRATRILSSLLVCVVIVGLWLRWSFNAGAALSYHYLDNRFYLSPHTPSLPPPPPPPPLLLLVLGTVETVLLRTKRVLYVSRWIDRHSWDMFRNVSST